MDSDYVGTTPSEIVRGLIEDRLLRKHARVWRRATRELTRSLRALSREEAQSLAADLWARRQRDELNRYLALLNVSVPGSLDGIYPALVAERQLRPASLYLGAPPAISDKLLRLLDETGSRGERNLLLLALAWIGDEHVRDQFRDWREAPPSWSGDLNLPPHEYAAQAGWELTVDG